MDFMDFIEVFSKAAGILFFLMFLHQIVYTIIALTVKTKKLPVPASQGRYAVLIAARNEQEVIGQLLDSLNRQKYPSELYDIFVIADNCTDDTANVCRQHGATVYERFNNRLVGKGYALDTLMTRMKEDGKFDYDAYLVFDADNLLDENYLCEMDRHFQGGKYDAITSYRNSKNYGDNWISAGYSLSFLREAQLMNRPRQILGTSGVVNGTGYMISAKTLETYGGWKFFSLTEDFEFTARVFIDGGKIGYCESAVFYDEQPTDFKQSWTQRLRWTKGYLQMLFRYGGTIVKTMFKKRSFACWDLICSFLPAFVVVAINTVSWVAELCVRLHDNISISPLLLSAFSGILTMYGILFLLGLATTLHEWKYIRTAGWKKVLYAFSFPLFLLTYIPISAQALFCRVEWKPISHKAAASVDEYLK